MSCRTGPGVARPEEAITTTPGPACESNTRRLLTLATLLYLPAIFLGYGSDLDSYEVLRMADILVTEWRYEPSRYPGYPLYELLTTLLNAVGGSVLTNLSTVVVSVVTLYVFKLTLVHHDIPNPSTLVLLLMTNAVYWVNSTNTMDYVWAMMLMQAGYLLVQRDRTIAGGCALGLAISTRATSVLFVLLTLVYLAVGRRMTLRDLLGVAAPAVLLPALFYLPTMLSTIETGILKPYFGPWNATDLLISVIFNHVVLLGFQALPMVVLLVLRHWHSGHSLGAHRGVVIFCASVVLAYEALYVFAPLEIEYLLPMLPWLIVAVGVIGRTSRTLLARWLVLQLTASWVSVSLLSVAGNPHVTETFVPTVTVLDIATLQGNVLSLSFGIYFGRGYVLNDMVDRVLGFISA